MADPTALPEEDPLVVAFRNLYEEMDAKVAKSYEEAANNLVAAPLPPLSEYWSDGWWFEAVRKWLPVPMEEALLEALIRESDRIGSVALPGLRDIRAEQAVEVIIQGVESWSESLRSTVASTVQKATEEGLSVLDATKLLEGQTFSPARADVAARTELNAAANAGSEIAMEEAGVEYKQYLATSDERTRTTHSDADGQIVRTSATFSIGGYRAGYPGSSELPVEERANCRCRVVPVFADELEPDEGGEVSLPAGVINAGWLGFSLFRNVPRLRRFR